jgi:beta-glucanase (GH16 family)
MSKASNHLTLTSAMNVFNFLLLIVALPFTLTLCQSTQAIRQQPSGILPVGQTGNWTMIFHDEFNGTALDTSKWTTCYFNFTVGNGCDHNQGELELYQPDDVFVSNGTLKLRAERRTNIASNGKTYNYTSGMITTGPTTFNSKDTRFAFQYGYMEMRAKVPDGTGLWPAFWTLPSDLSWPPEIDVFEILGNAPNVINMHYHYPNATGGDSDSGAHWAGPDFSATWHTYAVDWEPDAITWYVDGIERRSYTDTSHIVSKPMYLIANLAVGGDWPGPPDRTTRFPSYFEIDYVRVWKRAA